MTQNEKKKKHFADYHFTWKVFDLHRVHLLIPTSYAVVELVVLVAQKWRNRERNRERERERKKERCMVKYNHTSGF